MRRLPLYLGTTLCFLGVWLAGCGSDPEDIGNRVTVVIVAPVDANSAGFVFPGVEGTDDIGCDGDAAVEDPDGTQGNGFYDSCPAGESLEPLTDDLVDITLRNEPRPGVADGGRPVQVVSIRVTYRLPDGTTPAWAPARTVAWDLEVEPDSAATIESFPLVTKEMKAGDVGVPGVRDLFFTGAAGTEVFLQATVDIRLRDWMNDESFSAQARIGMSFINPNI